MKDNDIWLRKNCTAFLDSKLDDVALLEKAGLLRDAAHKRGILCNEVSQMYRKINNERAANEASKR